jgi:predicted cobalt transporter CbtA
MEGALNIEGMHLGWITYAERCRRTKYGCLTMHVLFTHACSCGQTRENAWGVIGWAGHYMHPTLSRPPSMPCSAPPDSHMRLEAWSQASGVVGNTRCAE